MLLTDFGVKLSVNSRSILFFFSSQAFVRSALKTEANHYLVARLKSIAIAYRIGSGKAAPLSALAANEQFHKVSFNVCYSNDSSAFPK